MRANAAHRGCYLKAPPFHVPKALLNSKGRHKGGASWEEKPGPVARSGDSGAVEETCEQALGRRRLSPRSHLQAGNGVSLNFSNKVLTERREAQASRFPTYFAGEKGHEGGER